MNIQGVAADADLDPKLINRQVMSLQAKTQQIVKEMAPLAILACGILVIFLPMLAEILVVVSWILFQIASKRSMVEGVENLPVDFHGLNKKRPFLYPKKRFKEECKKAQATWALGTDRETGIQEWRKSGTILRHMWIVGATGSGKTQFILALVYSAIAQESGVLMMDAKGSVATFWHFMSIVRRFDRLEDLFLLNFNRASLKDAADELTGKSRMTHSLSILNSGNAIELRDVIGGMLQDTGAPIWQAKTKSLFYVILKILCWQRDSGYCTITLDLFQEKCKSTEMLAWAKGSEQMPEAMRQDVKNFIEQSGGDSTALLSGDSDAKADPEFENQWSYMTMQITESMLLLGDEFKHIFGMKWSNINMRDIVMNRRLLYIILPTLEKSPESVGVLSRLIVGLMRRAFSSGLGAAVQGSKKELIESRVTNYKTPFLVVLDEYVQFGGKVEGLAAAAAMVRDMGISMIFGAQQEGSLSEESKRELVEVLGNTVTKLALLVEENQTARTFIDIAGQSLVAQEYQMERKENSMSERYVNSKQVHFNKVDKIEINDLRSQTPGQGHLVSGNKLSRIQVFAALADNDGGEIKRIESFKLTEFLPNSQISKADIDNFKRPRKKFSELIKNGPNINIEESLKLKEYVQWARRISEKSKLTPDQSARGAISAMTNYEPDRSLFEGKTPLSNVVTKEASVVAYQAKLNTEELMTAIVNEPDQSLNPVEVGDSGFVVMGQLKDEFNSNTQVVFKGAETNIRIEKIMSENEQLVSGVLKSMFTEEGQTVSTVDVIEQNGKLHMFDKVVKDHASYADDLDTNILKELTAEFSQEALELIDTIEHI